MSLIRRQSLSSNANQCINSNLVMRLGKYTWPRTLKSELKSFRFQMQCLNPMNDSPQTQLNSYSHKHSYILFPIQKLNWFEWFHWFEYIQQSRTGRGWIICSVTGEEERAALTKLLSWARIARWLSRAKCLKKDRWRWTHYTMAAKSMCLLTFLSAN